MNRFYSSLPYAEQQRHKDAIGKAATGKGLKKFVADRPHRFAWDQMTNTVSLVGVDGGDRPQRVRDQMTTPDTIVLSLEMVPSFAEWPQLSPGMVNAAVNKGLAIVTKSTTFVDSTRHPNKRVAIVTLGSSSDLQTAMTKTAIGETVVLHNKFATQSFQLKIYTDQQKQQPEPHQPQPHRDHQQHQQHCNTQYAQYAARPAHNADPLAQTAPLQQGQASGGSWASHTPVASPPQLQQIYTQPPSGQWPQYMHDTQPGGAASALGGNAREPHAGGRISPTTTTVAGQTLNVEVGTPEYDAMTMNAAYEQFLADSESLTLAPKAPKPVAGQRVEAKFKAESRHWKLATVIALQPGIDCYILEFDGYQDLQKGIPPERIRTPIAGAGAAFGPKV